MVIQMPNPLTSKIEKVLHSLQQLPFWGDLSVAAAKTILKEAEAFLYYKSLDSTLGQGRSMHRIYQACETYNGSQFTSIAKHLAGDYGQAHRYRRAYEEALRYLPSLIVEEGVERGNTWGDKGVRYSMLRDDEPFGKYTTAIFSLLPVKVTNKTSARSWWDKVDFLYASRPKKRA